MFILRNFSFDANDGKGEEGIIRDINLMVDDGEFVIIASSNGGGEPTVAKLIAEIERPTGGCILFGGQDITDIGITDRANLGISFAFQQPVRFKGVQVLDLLRLASGKTLTVIEACRYLAEVGPCTKDYINHEVNVSLSRGEFRRIEIATTIARESKFSVSDEPEAGTDLRGFQNLTQTLEHMRQSTDGSILITSRQGRTLNVADEIVVITDGRVVNQGTRDEIMPWITGTASAVDACNKFYEIAQSGEERAT